MIKRGIFFSIITLSFLIPMILGCSQEDRGTPVQRQESARKIEQIRQGAATLRIMSPAEEASVRMTELVRGTVSDPKLNVYILIHPLTTNLWWVQNIPAVGPDGRWQALCYFGTENLGIGEPYEIIAIASSKRGLYKPGDTLKEVPSKLLRSKIVTVKRSK